MADRHVNDPLDYLYEELPPDEMEEARAHLAECAQCRRELKKIRDAVKVYRRAAPPTAPAGLAARTAALVLERRKTDSADAAESMPEAERENGPAGIAPRPETDQPFDSDQDFEREKDRIICEAGGWRARLFHPAWTVAASVLFVCAVLIHFSPRKDLLFPPLSEPTPERISETPAAKPTPPAGRKQKTARQATAKSAAAMDAKQDAVEFSPRSPILVEAEALNAAPEPRQGNDAADSADIAAQEAATAPEPPPPQPGPAPMAATMRSMPAQKMDEPFGQGAAGAESIMMFDAAPPVAPMPDAFAMPEEAAAPLEPRSGETAAPPAVVIDMAPPGEPPQLLARPQPIDDARSVLTLSFLAGLQMGERDFEGARQTIELIRKRDADEANRLARVLIDMLLAESENAAEKADGNGPAASAGQEIPEVSPAETHETEIEQPEDREAADQPTPEEPAGADQAGPERVGSDAGAAGKTGETPGASLRPPVPAIEPALRESETPAEGDGGAAPGESGETGEVETRQSGNPAPASESAVPESTTGAAEPHPLHIEIEIGPVYADAPAHEPALPDNATASEPAVDGFTERISGNPPPMLRESESEAGLFEVGQMKNGGRNRFTTDPYWREQ